MSYAELVDAVLELSSEEREDFIEMVERIRSEEKKALPHLIKDYEVDYTATKKSNNLFKSDIVPYTIELQIEKLPEGYYLATSKDLQGLVVQGKTIDETIEISKDVARKIIDFRKQISHFKSVKEKFNYPIILEL